MRRASLILSFAAGVLCAAALADSLTCASPDGKNTLVVEYWLSSIHHVAKEIPLKGSKPYLRVTGSRDHYRFSFSEDGKTFTEVGVADTRYLSSETAGGFTGIILALFCQSASDTSKPQADFYSFNYHPVK